MFPKIGRGIADLQFVYLHCEIELMPLGFAPTCDDTAFGKAIKNNLNASEYILDLGIFSISVLLEKKFTKII